MKSQKKPFDDFKPISIDEMNRKIAKTYKQKADNNDIRRQEDIIKQRDKIIKSGDLKPNQQPVIREHTKVRKAKHNLIVKKTYYGIEIINKAIEENDELKRYKNKLLKRLLGKQKELSLMSEFINSYLSNKSYRINNLKKKIDKAKIKGELTKKDQKNLLKLSKIQEMIMEDFEKDIPVLHELYEIDNKEMKRVIKDLKEYTKR